MNEAGWNRSPVSKMTNPRAVTLLTFTSWGGIRDIPMALERRTIAPGNIHGGTFVGWWRDGSTAKYEGDADPFGGQLAMWWATR